MFEFQFDHQPLPSTTDAGLDGKHVKPGSHTAIVQAEFIHLNQQIHLLKRMISDIRFEIIHQEKDELPISNVIETQSDLIPLVYEGGLKTWECSFDLLNYLSKINLQDKTVMELGCGSALPGIYALTQGAHVDFQDYNEDVIQMLTMPNVLLNTNQEFLQAALNNELEFELDYRNLSNQSQFYSGDWGNFEGIMLQQHYDLIITSESIYAQESHAKLIQLMKYLLKKDGIILVAAKSFYFGCSGSLNSFLESCKTLFDINVKWTDSSSVRREIVELRLK